MWRCHRFSQSQCHWPSVAYCSLDDVWFLLIRNEYRCATNFWCLPRFRCSLFSWFQKKWGETKVNIKSNSSQLTYQRNVPPSAQICPKQWHSHNDTIQEDTQRNSMVFHFLVQCDSLQLKSKVLICLLQSSVWKYWKSSITHGRLGRWRSMLLLQIQLKIKEEKWVTKNAENHHNSLTIECKDACNS